MADSIGRRGIRLLSLDGGGVRGLSSLLILKDILCAINPDDPPKPCEVFDLIGGTSTGGIIAIMLGVLRMDVDKCIQAYKELSKDVFNPTVAEWRKITRAYKKYKAVGKFNYKKLEASIKDTVKKELESLTAEAEMLRSPSRADQCKAFVCSMSTNITRPVLIRNYRNPRARLDVECTIWEAARATSAAPGFFDPITINGETFSDGATGSNNPIFHLWREAHEIWPDLDDRLQSLVSLGTGEKGYESFEGNIIDLAEKVAKICTETGQTHDKFYHSHLDLFKNGKAFRFNAPLGNQIGLDDYESSGFIVGATRDYMESGTIPDEVNNFVDALNQDVSIATLSDISSLKYLLFEDFEAVQIEKVPENCEGTCDWVLELDEFRRWAQGDTDILWLTGESGSGKTVLTAFLAKIVPSVLNRSVPSKEIISAFYFFNYNSAHTLTINCVIRAMIYQLATQKVKSILDALDQEYRTYRDKFVMSNSSLWRILESGLKKLHTSRSSTILLCLDGLDECEENVTMKVIQRMRKIIQVGNGNIKAIFASKPFRYMRGIFADNVARIDMGDGRNTNDIMVFITKRLESISEFRNLPSNVMADAKCFLAENNQGSFLWTSLILDELSEADVSTMDLMRKQLHDMPKTLTRLYTSWLSDVPKEQWDFASRVITWLITTSKPLSLLELNEALAAQVCNDGERWYEFLYSDLESELRNALGPMLRIQKDSVKLVHKSFQDFLIGIDTTERPDLVERRSQFRDEGSAHLIVVIAILKYIGWLDLGDSGTSISLRNIVRNKPFARYASCSWRTHLELSDKATNRKLLSHLALVYNENTVKKAMQLYVAGYSIRLGVSVDYVTVDPFVMACISGHTFLVDFFLKTSPNLLLKDYSESAGPLQSAVMQQKTEVVKRLLGHKPSSQINTKTKLGFTPLHFAACHETKDLLVVLLENGALPNVGGGYFAGLSLMITPLHIAVCSGRKDNVRELIKAIRPSDYPILGAKDYSHVTPLHLSLAFGHDEISELLMNSPGCDGKRSTYFNTTPLHLAAPRSGLHIIEMLLKAGVDVDARDFIGRSALHYAIANKRNDVANLLLDHNASTTNPDDDGIYAMELAAAASDLDLVRRVREVDAIASFTAPHALHEASITGNIEIVEDLISSGYTSDLNAPSKNNFTALQCAIYHGHNGVRDILLSAGADLNDQGEHAIVHVMSRFGELKQVQEVVALGANPNMLSTDSKRTPLHHAARGGKLETFQYLISLGCSFEAEDYHDNTCLHLSARSGNLDLFIFILKLCPPIDTCRKNSHDRTILHKAVKSGNCQLVAHILRLPSSERIGIDCLDCTGHDAISLAIRYGFCEIVELLCEYQIAAGKFSLLIRRYLKKRLTLLEFATMCDNPPILAALSRAVYGDEESDVVRRRGSHKLGQRAHDVGAKVIFKNGWTPLHYASDRGSTSVVKLLLSMGHPPHLATDEGVTPLHVAASQGRIEAVKVLLEHSDVNPEAVDKAGFNALHAVIYHIDKLEPDSNYRSVGWLHGDLDPRARWESHQYKGPTYWTPVHEFFHRLEDFNIRLNDHVLAHEDGLRPLVSTEEAQLKPDSDVNEPQASESDDSDPDLEGESELDLGLGASSSQGMRYFPKEVRPDRLNLLYPVDSSYPQSQMGRDDRVRYHDSWETYTGRQSAALVYHWRRTWEFSKLIWGMPSNGGNGEDNHFQGLMSFCFSGLLDICVAIAQDAELFAVDWLVEYTGMKDTEYTSMKDIETLDLELSIPPNLWAGLNTFVSPTVAQLLLSAPGGIESGLAEHSTPLIPELETIERLAERCDVNCQTEAGYTALHMASRNGHVDIMKRLMKRGADPTIRDKAGDTPVNLALRSPYIVVEMLQAFAEHGFDFSQTTSTTNPIEIIVNAVKNLKNFSQGAEIFNYLLAHGVDITSRPLTIANPDGTSEVVYFIQLAALSGFETVLPSLLSMGKDITEALGSACLPLFHCAARSNNIVVFRQVVDYLKKLNDGSGQAEGSLIRRELDRRCLKDGNLVQHHHDITSLEIIRLLLKLGMDPNTVDARGYSALHIAVLKGRTEIANILMNEGKADVDMLAHGKRTPISLVDLARWNKGSAQLLQDVCNRGGRIDIPDERGRTLLHTAAKHGKPGALKAILDQASRLGKPSLINQADMKFMTPLHYAVKRGSLRKSEYLLRAGAKPRLRRSGGTFESPIDIAMVTRNADLLRLLLQYDRPPEEIERFSWRWMRCVLLEVAGKEGWTSIFRKLLQEHGEDRHVRETSLKTSLFVEACRLKHHKIFKILCQSSLPTRVRCDTSGYTVLHEVCRRGLAKFLNTLVRHRGKDLGLEDRDDHGCTALHHAITHGHWSIAFELLRLGSDPRALTNDWLSPLHLAPPRKRHWNMVSYLINHTEADPTVLDVSGISPIHFVCKTGDEFLARAFLEKRPEALDSPDPLGYTPLHLAVKSQNKYLVEYLLEKGASPSQPSFVLIPPLWTAIEEVSNLEIVKLLIRYRADPLTPKCRTGHNCLHRAAMSQNAEMVEYFLGIPEDLDRQDDFGRRPYTFAEQPRIKELFTAHRFEDSLL